MSKIYLRDKILRDKWGYCGICGEWSKLTEDHFPPKSCSNNSPVEINAGNSSIVSKNGMKFRTLCLDCNNFLGSNFDKEIKNVYTTAHSLYESAKLLYINRINIPIDAKSYLRGILGHYLASIITVETKTSKEIIPFESDYFSSIKDFVCGDSNELNDISIYYWFYPYDDIRFNSFFSCTPDFIRKSKDTAFGGIIKFFPFSLWIIYKKISTIVPQISELRPDSTHILFDIHRNIAKDFPERPTKKGAVLMNIHNEIQGHKKN